MPLRDHFHPPLSNFCPWASFHANWSVKMVDRLNTQHLKRGKYTAQSGRHFGAQIEADVATLERIDRGSLFEEPESTNGGVATATSVYSPPAATLSATVTFDDPDLFEVKVYRGPGGWELVAAVELVSEANKDREEHRRAFAVKCASYLQKGVALVVVDTVTTYSDNLHDELCELIDNPDSLRWASPSGLSVVSYRATRGAGKTGPALGLDVYPFAVGIGQALPTVPLWLGRGPAVPLELEMTYQQACTSLQLD
jgi:hypothetical protein